MTDNDPNVWQMLVIWATAVVAWAGGEAGRVMVAGGAGGIFRWFMSQKRRIRDGAIAVLTGILSAKYMSPLALVVVEKGLGDLGEGPDIAATAAFMAGLLGMSIAKVIIALFEKQSDRLTGDGNG